MDGWLIKFWKMVNRKILIINNGLAGGGIERASISLANHFAEIGYQVSVMALYKSKHFFKLNESIKFIEPVFKRTKFNKYFYVLKMMAYIKKNAKQLKPDTILAFGEWTNPFVIIALQLSGFPIFVSDRMNPMGKLPFLSESLRKIFYKKATGVISQTSFAKNILYKKTKAKNIKVIHNPVNAVEKVKCEQKKRIVSIGRLEKVKGHKFLIEAFAKVNDKSWELSLVGDGDERIYLENLADKLGVRNRIIFHGHLQDFSLQLSEAQIFVLPSLKEGFPNALIEAMSVPLACISGDFFAGSNEIVEEGINGLIVRPGNVDDLSFALNRLIENESLREKIAKNGVKVRETLAFETIAQQYLDFINQI
jgi:GalNAc-alpha-(1->4)-GalNAc-alpha-(1->3)-diNAcBac-PP-undecaprenol alpha-1,4-N-acetyl-D-galactosaminyltransferase